MTDDNRKENMRAELSRAEEAFKAADLRALLLSRGLEPRSHEGALRLLGLHFIREGLLEKDVAQVFSKLMKFREEADYNPVSMFTKEDYMEYRKEAMELADAIRHQLGM